MGGGPRGVGAPSIGCPALLSHLLMGSSVLNPSLPLKRAPFLISAWGHSAERAKHHTGKNSDSSHREQGREMLGGQGRSVWVGGTRIPTFRSAPYHPLPAGFCDSGLPAKPQPSVVLCYLRPRASGTPGHQYLCLTA